eukprot:COSAG01_NODE_1911_length_8925_cov_151.747111_3_plen_55_part_00
MCHRSLALTHLLLPSIHNSFSVPTHPLELAAATKEWPAAPTSPSVLGRSSATSS